MRLFCGIYHLITLSGIIKIIVYLGLMTQINVCQNQPKKICLIPVNSIYKYDSDSNLYHDSSWKSHEIF